MAGLWRYGRKTMTEKRGKGNRHPPVGKVFFLAAERIRSLAAVAPSPARPSTAQFDFAVPHQRFELLAGQAAVLKEDKPGHLQLEIPGQSYAIYRVVAKP